ncbi:hypothetical protein PHAVU_008G106600 [Phaseolus vulgaris]|uniref:non-specific serine/threonine protein kinase n=1 Tax=Phaseolus vulgaris TaxID=3885 RepID=V7B7C0_PHAVU|nr:hypothetical protein PHAVU_008G106600g [Phaseolus vulgaris]ESW12371.1 hypothetical protein PHAVU_008G106600g [Phaseolus vulgaris]
MKLLSLWLLLVVMVSSLHATLSSSLSLQHTKANALLKWKASLDIRSQTLLSTWDGSISNINLTNIGVSGTLQTLYFSSLPNIFNLDTSLNSLSRTNLTRTIPNSIGKLSFLSILLLWNCSLTGSIPKSIGNLISLLSVEFSFNKLYGHIPHKIGNLSYLKFFRLGVNYLYGCIPQNMKNLFQLNLSLNSLSQMNGLNNLEYLQLYENNFIGHLPHNICVSGKLIDFSVSNNYFTGLVPNSLKNCSSLIKVLLEQNHLTGNIIEDLSHSTGTKSGKQFTYIPEELGNLIYLIELSIYINNLSENVTIQITSLQRLDTLKLKANNLFGQINLMISLTFVDISYNQLEGPLPNILAFNTTTIEALKDNKGFCGNVSGLEPCPTSRDKSQSHKTNRVILVLLPISLSICMLALFVFGVSYHLYKSFDGKMVYENIIEATKEFDNKHLIGVGGQGSVYKAELQTNQIVVFKKFHSIQNGEISNVKAFKSEIQALTEIRYGFCSHSRFSFLVYEFLEKGSTNKILKDDEQDIAFNWNKRFDAIKGVSNALFYIHHDCSPPIVHRDISSKNVLLNLEYVAHVSDFGTINLLNPNSTIWTSFVGIFGYASPEFTYTMEVNEKCHVYNFGVLALEILFGKHLKDFINSFLTSSSKLDKHLSYPVNITKEIALIVRIANVCLTKSPSFCLP